MSTLVIASKQEKGVGIPHFQRPEVEHTLKSHISLLLSLPSFLRTDLDGEVASVYIVPQEQIACLSRVPSDLEKLHQVVLRQLSASRLEQGIIGAHILPVDVSTNYQHIQPRARSSQSRSSSPVIGASTSSKFGSDRSTAPPL